MPCLFKGATVLLCGYCNLGCGGGWCLSKQTFCSRMRGWGCDDDDSAFLFRYCSDSLLLNYQFH